ncbi:MAG: ferrochelatase [Gammaproteobacteria bacterium]|jgi:ferrochelatase
MNQEAATFQHDAPECTGVLLVNLGTPDAPDKAAVRRYLKEFLWDPRVVELARPLWWPILNLVILNTRPRRSAHAYAKIWSEEGSPLLVISQRQRTALESGLQAIHGPGVRVALAMRYGNPSIAAGLDELRRAGARRLLVLPLYPQYSATTTASTFDAVSRELRSWRWLPELRFVNHYHDHPGYIGALARSVEDYWAEHGRPDRLVMSFHGIPEAYFQAGDPYFCECQKTGRLLAGELGLQAEQWTLTFQSRLGPKQWLKPYTDKTLRALGREGVQGIHVICPGFSADCLETLEEINLQDRDIFLQAGGKHFGYIPCLNDAPAHLDALCEIVGRHLSGWPVRPEGEPEQWLEERKQRAAALGARA